MIDASVFLKRPIKFNSVCTIYPPSVNEVVDTPKAFQLFKLLTYSQEDIEDFYFEQAQKSNGENGATNKKIPTPLEFVLINSYQSKDFEALIKEAFLFFIHEPITFLYEQKMLLVGDAIDLAKITDFKQLRYFSEENFFDFQNTLRGAMGNSAIKLPDPNENPITKRVKAAARRRKRLAAKSKEKNGGGISLTTTLGAICCMGIGLTPLNIGEISYASIEVLMTLYQQKEKYQTDIDSLMAGASPKKVHPKYWIREQSEFHDVKI